MIFPVERAPEWSSDDAAQLNGFLASSTGDKLIELLCYLAPVLLDGGDVNKTLVACGEVKGYTEAVSTLCSLRNSRPVEATGEFDTYPNLDDDSKWKDVDAR